VNKNEELAVICSADRVDIPSKGFGYISGYVPVALISGFIGFIIGALLMASIKL